MELNNSKNNNNSSWYRCVESSNMKGSEKLSEAKEYIGLSLFQTFQTKSGNTKKQDWLRPDSRVLRC